MKKSIIFLCSFLFAVALQAQTPRIEFGQKGLYPEGTVFDVKGQRFFVSSATTGTIGSVSPSGNYRVFYQNDSLKSTFGMKIDVSRNRLWVCAGDPNYSIYKTPATFHHQIRLIGLDLSSGKKTEDIDLTDVFPGQHFANDLALDEKGNIYVTDSYSPVIYKIDAKGKASVLATNDLFKGQGVGLNGIVYQKGYLLVVNSSSGNLLKVTLGNPMMVSAVECSIFFNGGDGMLWDGADLLISQNKGINKITRIHSSDGWKSAQKISATSGEDRFSYPSTLAQSGSRFYALNAKLNELTDSSLPKSQNFSLQEIILK